jgi:hypothetical protein
VIDALIDQAESELKNGKALTAIDTLLNAFAILDNAIFPTYSSRLLNLYSQAILEYKQVQRELWGDQPVAGLFQNDLLQPTREFIGLCLLRLLAQKSECFKDPSLSHRSYALFDELFAGNLYQWYNISAKDQTYQKQSKLASVFPEREKELSTLIATPSTLEALINSNFHERFMGAIKNRKTQQLIWPFLPPHLLDSELNHIFKVVKYYFTTVNTQPTKMFEVYEESCEELHNYRIKAEGYGTRYSREYLAGIAQRLLDLLHQHSSNYPMSKPARLSISTSEKKYPFAIPGSHLLLGFTITNTGPGHARDVSMSVELEDAESIQLEKAEAYLGHLEVSSINVELPAQVVQPATSPVSGMIQVQWTNFDKSPGIELTDFELLGQRADVDWEKLRREDPYSLDPVETEDQLVGRQDILAQLIAQTDTGRLGSFYIHGQKRVGKTSIVRTLATRLAALYTHDFQVVYLEAGDYVKNSAQQTTEELGRQLCRKIQRADSRFSALEIPAFTDGALSPLSSFLDDVLYTVPGYRILFILDEFDWLPHELYQRGPVGDAFFLTLKSISSKPPFGFILVGGEKMEFVISYQGININKFEPIQVDYFDRERHWTDFQDLVRKPTQAYLEFSDAALLSLYDQTAGNPYFTKLICRVLFKRLVDRRDCHVTPREVMEAINPTLDAVGSGRLENNSFQHFWDDGLFDAGPRLEERSIARRKVLVMLAESFNQQNEASTAEILRRAPAYHLQEADVRAELKDFVRRQVLLLRGDIYTCRVPFFASWLKARGIHDIITTFADLDLAQAKMLEEEGAYVKPQEILALLQQRAFRYRGLSLTEDGVRAWLEQFRSNRERRLMFHILENLTFYNRDHVRGKLKEAHGIVRRGLVRRIEEGQRKRRDILVSYLDSPGKSGANYARLYADENDIYYENVVERGKLCSALERTHAQALVFIDDFIGTGKSACKYFTQLDKECHDLLCRTPVRLFFIAICAFAEGKAEVERLVSELGLPIQIHVCDSLDDSARCFHETSHIFPHPEEREAAKQIALRYGLDIVKEMASEDMKPLGFGDSQATVVFEDSCPNNTLPILWAKTPTWNPLFKR